MKIFAAVIAVLALGITGYLVYENTRPDTVKEIVPPPSFSADVTTAPEEPAPTMVEQAPDQETIEEAGLGPVPDLEGSDEYLKSLLQDEPGWKSVLETKNYVRKAATTVDLLSRDENPVSQVRFLQPKTPFKATKDGDRLLLSRENYARYDPLIAFVSGLDVQRGALLYRHLYPVFTVAYGELGNGDQAFPQKLDQVMKAILDFQPPEGDIEIAGEKGNFIFSDANLEAKSPLEKALIRMGPANVAQLQEKIREFRNALKTP